MKLQRRRPMSGVPLSSMGDIAFLLLIFYMSTTMVSDQKPRTVDLPQVNAESKTSPYPLVIYVDRKLAESDKVFFFNKEIPVSSLSAQLQEQASAAPAAVRVYLNMEKDLPFQKMNEVLGAIKKAGIRSLIITTKPGETPSGAGGEK